MGTVAALTAIPFAARRGGETPRLEEYELRIGRLDALGEVSERVLSEHDLAIGANSVLPCRLSCVER